MRFKDNTALIIAEAVKLKITSYFFEINMNEIIRVDIVSKISYENKLMR